jgi:hypothetical protein
MGKAMKCKVIALAVATAIAGIAQAGSIQFTNAAVTTIDLDKRSILASNFAMVDGQKVDVSYSTILRSGDMPKGSEAPFGLLINIDGDPVIYGDGLTLVSNGNDFSSLLVSKNKGRSRVFMVSHFESRAAAMYLTELDQDKKTGELTAARTRPLDFSHINGGRVHCAGSVSPWGTHIGSEQYPPDGKEWRDGNVSGYNAEMVGHFPVAQGAQTVQLPDLALQYMNPYDYGYVSWVAVESFDDATVTRHYSMVRALSSWHT